MKRLLLLAAFTLLLSACGERGSIGGLLVVEGRHAVEAGTTIAGDLFVLGGELVLEPGARVTGSAYILGGNVEIAGTVAGDVAVAGGAVRIREEAVVSGGLRRGGGEVDVAPGASVGSELVSPVAVDAVLGLAQPVAEADRLSGWLGVQVPLAAVVAALVTWLAPRGVARIGEAVAAQPLVPLAVGLLGLIVGTSLLVFMVFTVVLIPVALLLALAGVLGTGIGLVSLGYFAVRRLLGGRVFGGRHSLQAAAGSAFLAAALGLVSLVPLIGEITLGIIVATAMGSWLVTRFGTRDLRLASD